MLHHASRRAGCGELRSRRRHQKGVRGESGNYDTAMYPAELCVLMAREVTIEVTPPACPPLSTRHPQPLRVEMTRVPSQTARGAAQIDRLHCDKKGDDGKYEHRPLGEFDDRDGHYSVRRISTRARPPCAHAQRARRHRSAVPS